MPHIDPDYHAASVLTLLVLAAALVASRLHRRRTTAALYEATIVLTLFTAWSFIGSHTNKDQAQGRERGHQLYDLEQRLHLPSEVSVNHLVQSHAGWSHLINGYYLYGHFNVMIGLLAWTFFRHREAYARLRLTVVLFTASAFCVQFYAIAPPRLTPGLGFVDLANKYGESVYVNHGNFAVGELLAMPSVHVGWAALTAWTVWRVSPSRWRYVVVAHFPVMVFVVVASANHWWADGIVSVALLCVTVPLSGLLLARWRSLVVSRRLPAVRLPAPETVPAA